MKISPTEAAPAGLLPRLRLLFARSYDDYDASSGPYRSSGSRPRRGRRKDNARRSDTTMWLLGGCGCLGMLLLACPIAIALILPAVNQAREAARRTICQEQMKEILIALHNYHDLNGSLPPAYVTDAAGRPLFSWRVLLLPFLGESDLYSQFDQTKPWDDPVNLAVLNQLPDVYRCPSEPESNSTNTSYLAAFGPRCAFQGPKGLKFRDLKNGLSQTIFISEAQHANVPWTAPFDMPVDSGVPLGQPGSFCSLHVRGLNVGYADATVRFIPDAELSTLQPDFYVE